MTHGWKSGELDMSLVGDERSSCAFKTVMASQLAMDHSNIPCSKPHFLPVGNVLCKLEKKIETFIDTFPDSKLLIG